jgi:threonylcarbamoyladenosine tRNA methylthiotransferase MtaB
MGSWGQDLDSSSNIINLITDILSKTDIPRLRLSSLEPWDINDEFFELWQDNRLANHLHLPLQSGCEATLKRMRRKTSPKEYANLIKSARKWIEGVAITTDIITGFPGENDDEFEESLAFIEEMAFARGHVFTYSERPGTAASQMACSVPYPIRKARNAKVRQILAKSEKVFQKNAVGAIRPVLWEKVSSISPVGWALSGLTDDYLRVSAHANHNLWNQITYVKITGLDSYGLIGEVIE